MQTRDPLASCQRVPGSFRDPSGYVFRRGTGLFRAIDEGTHDIVGGLESAGVLDDLVHRDLLVATRVVPPGRLRDALAAENTPFEHFLEHEAIHPLTFPYEWSVSMLADAAVLTLDLQIQLVRSGYSLKDATAFNVQFRNGRPVFIDVPSIWRPKRLDIWPALGQFSPMFTFPLLLTRYHGWDLRSYFLANIAGLPVERVVRAVGRISRWRPRYLLDVTLPSLLTSRRAGRNPDVNEIIERETNRDSRSQILNLKRLRSKIKKLASSYKPRGLWAAYVRGCSYGEASDQAKQRLVGEYLREFRPTRVLDLGCNTGTYSRIAVENGAKAIAVDSDHDAVELLYRELRRDQADLVPLVVDLFSPSPGLGYMNEERETFVSRAESDCVLALALVHHLLITGNLGLQGICRLLLALTTDHLVLELIPRDDPMYRELLKKRVGGQEGLPDESLRDSLLARFELVRETAVPDTARTLLFLRRRRGQGHA